MNIEAMAEILLYGALFLGMCLLLATRAYEPIEVEEEEMELPELPRLRYPRSQGQNRRKRKITRYYL